MKCATFVLPLTVVKLASVSAFGFNVSPAGSSRPGANDRAEACERPVQLGLAGAHTSICDR